MRSIKRTLTAAGLVLAAILLGVWLEGLRVEAQDATGYTDLTLTDDLTVGDDATVGGDLAVTGAITGGSFGSSGALTATGAGAVDPTTASVASYGGTTMVFEGATANASEGNLVFGDVTADRTWTFGAAGDMLFGGTVTADPTTAGLAAFGGTGIVFEGATADAFELTFTAADATADHSLAWSAVGTLTSSATYVATGAALADPVTASTASYGGTSVVYEGATADAFEQTLTVADATADHSLTWGAVGTLTSSATYVATGAGLADPVTASTTSYGGTTIVAEGSTADGFETSIAFTDPTADSTLTIGAAGQVTSDAASLGWAYVTGANTACTTTCASAAVFGVDLAGGATAPVIVGPADASADACVCAGAS